MSFSKAPIKRFNENDTNTPGPSEYDPKNPNAKGAGSGVALTLKASRFTEKKEITPGPGEYEVSNPHERNVRTVSASTIKDGNFDCQGALVLYLWHQRRVKLAAIAFQPITLYWGKRSRMFY